MSDNPLPPLHYAPRPEPFTPPVSLRDYFAAKAMASLVRTYDKHDAALIGCIASDAYAIADAMLAERGHA